MNERMSNPQDSNQEVRELKGPDMDEEPGPKPLEVEVEWREEAAAGGGAMEEAELQVEEMKPLSNGMKGGSPFAHPGLTNGKGFTNGKGITNGRGITNGKGMTNGVRFEGGPRVNGLGRSPGGERDAAGPGAAARKRRRGIARYAAAAALAIVLILVIPLVFYMLQVGEHGIIIDGEFGDWEDVPRYPDAVDDMTGAPSINLVNFSRVDEDRSISFLLEVMPGHEMLDGGEDGVDIARIFLDADSDPSTGHTFMGLGADRMVSVHGYSNKVVSAALFRFNQSGRARDDWSGWTAPISIQASSDGNRLELRMLKVDVAIGDPDAPDACKDAGALVVLLGPDGEMDVSDFVVTGRSGALAVHTAWLAPDIMDQGATDLPLMSMRFGNAVAPIDIFSLSVVATGTASGDVVDRLELRKDDGDGEPEPLEDTVVALGAIAGGQVSFQLSGPLRVMQGSDTVLFITADISSSVPDVSKTFGLRLERSGVGTGQEGAGMVVREADRGLSYVGSVPPGIVIDGMFADWAPVHGFLDRMGDVAPERLDIREFKVAFSGLAFCFFVQTGGEMMAGTVMPERPFDRFTEPEPPSQPSPVPEVPVVTGEDVLEVFLDTDQRPSTGYQVPDQPIGAEFMVRVSGKWGVVGSSSLFVHVPGSYTGWTRMGPVDAAIDIARLELSVPLSSMGLDPDGRADVFFFTTGWDGAVDLAPVVVHDPSGNLTVDGIDIVPDSVKAGASNIPMLGLDFHSDFEVILSGLEFLFRGNLQDRWLLSAHIHRDDGDDAFDPLRDPIIDSVPIDHGTAHLGLEPPLTVHRGLTLTVFLSIDLSAEIEGAGLEVGASLDASGVSSSAARLVPGTGAFPIEGALASVSLADDRANNNTINLTDDAIDTAWSKASKEGGTHDKKDNDVEDDSDLTETRVSDNGTWLYFYVATVSALNTSANVHVYMDMDGDGNWDYDLVYCRGNDTVILWKVNGTGYDQIILPSTDRYDRVANELEVGIEFQYINFTNGSANNFTNYVSTEADALPGGSVLDRTSGYGPGAPSWSDTYTTIPEFRDAIIPIVATLAAFILMRRTGRRSGRVRKGGQRAARNSRQRANNYIY